MTIPLLSSGCDAHREDSDAPTSLPRPAAAPVFPSSAWLRCEGEGSGLRVEQQLRMQQLSDDLVLHPPVSLHREEEVEDDSGVDVHGHSC